MGRLDKMAESFSQKDIKKLDGGFEKIEKSADITPAQQQRILSSVMRKAGIEMNDNRTRDNIKVSRGFKGFGAVAAAAAVLIVGISAVSVANMLSDDSESIEPKAGSSFASAEDKSAGQFADKELTDHLLGEGSYDLINKYGLYETYTAEDECFKMSFGSIVSDGSRAKLMMKIEGKTEQAREYLKEHSPTVYVFDPETNEQARSVLVDTDASLGMPSDGLSAYADGDSAVYYSSYWITTSFADGYSAAKKLHFQLGIDRFADSGAYAHDYNSEKIDENRANVIVDLSKNIPAKEFVSEDGKSVTLSPYGLVNEEYTDEDSINGLYYSDKDDVILTLEYSDGQKHDVTAGELAETIYGYIGFEKVRPDPDFISAVDIGSRRYTAETKPLTEEKTKTAPEEASDIENNAVTTSEKADSAEEIPSQTSNKPLIEDNTLTDPENDAAIEYNPLMTPEEASDIEGKTTKTSEKADRAEEIPSPISEKAQ